MKSFKKKLSALFSSKSIEPITKEIVIQKKTLVLGFFDRGNLGDEAFKTAYSYLFPNCVFKSIDDTQEIGKDVSAVILAGGDLCNEYFMEKVKILLQCYMGPCYAFSIGIPYRICIHYLSMFDNVILRSKQDLTDV